MARIFVLLLIAMATCRSASAAAPLCPEIFIAYANASQPLTCSCPAGARARGTVWGTDVYTNDSHVCVAARHAGAIGADGGTVTVQPAPGRDSYEGAERNGVTSLPWGRFQWSFAFAGVAPHTAAAAPTAPPPTATPPPAEFPAAAPPAPAASPGAAAPASPLPEAAVYACPENFTAFAGAGHAMTCTCAPEAASAGSVWGTDIYTADSGICRAALHAGAVAAQGGTVTLAPLRGRSAYQGSARNGVETQSYGSFDASYRFKIAGGPEPAAAASVPPCPTSFEPLAAAGQPLTCSCDGASIASGSVWGTDVYTADSRICRAALHAGMVGLDGGTVTLLPEPGRQSYAGSIRNSVQSESWGSFGASYRFAPAGIGPAAATATPACPATFVLFAKLGQDIACSCASDATASGNVWGTDLYTTDSSVCRAARHAGVVGVQGGTVVVVPTYGQKAYVGTSRKGVTSDSWGVFETSFRVVPPPPGSN